MSKISDFYILCIILSIGDSPNGLDLHLLTSRLEDFVYNDLRPAVSMNTISSAKSHF